MLYLFYQDLRYRAVYWFVFPILFVLLSWYVLQLTAFDEVLINAAFNLGFFLMQLLLLSLYFSLKHKSLVNITRQFLGWGDVLFLVCITVCLSPGNYMVFYIGSLILIAIPALIVNKSTSQQKIPLAGLQALLFAGTLIADWCSPAINLNSDNWILNYLNL